MTAYRLIKICPTCGNEFHQVASNPVGRKYCSPKCKKIARAIAVVNAWNEMVPLGAPVILTKKSGEQIPTTTRTVAKVLDNGVAVIWLEGSVGCYRLSRVRPVAELERVSHG